MKGIFKWLKAKRVCGKLLANRFWVDWLVIKNLRPVYNVGGGVQCQRSSSLWSKSLPYLTCWTKNIHCVNTMFCIINVRSRTNRVTFASSFFICKSSSSFLHSLSSATGESQSVSSICGSQLLKTRRSCWHRPSWCRVCVSGPSFIIIVFLSISPSLCWWST